MNKKLYYITMVLLLTFSSCSNNINNSSNGINTSINETINSSIDNTTVDNNLSDTSIDTSLDEYKNVEIIEEEYLDDYNETRMYAEYYFTYQRYENSKPVYEEITVKKDLNSNNYVYTRNDQTICYDEKGRRIGYKTISYNRAYYMFDIYDVDVPSIDSLVFKDELLENQGNYKIHYIYFHDNEDRIYEYILEDNEIIETPKYKYYETKEGNTTTSIIHNVTLGWYGDGSKYAEKQECKYNDKGLLSQYKYYSSDRYKVNEEVNWEPWKLIEYKYDSFDRIVEVRYLGFNHTILPEGLYPFDNYLEKIKYNEDGSYTSSRYYFEHKKAYTLESFDEESIPYKYYSETDYDKHGNVLNSTFYDIDNDMSVYKKVICNRDAFGNTTEFFKYELNPETSMLELYIHYICDYKYNVRGELVYVNVYSPLNDYTPMHLERKSTKNYEPLKQIFDGSYFIETTFLLSPRTSYDSTIECQLYDLDVKHI